MIVGKVERKICDTLIYLVTNKRKNAFEKSAFCCFFVAIICDYNKALFNYMVGGSILLLFCKLTSSFWVVFLLFYALLVWQAYSLISL